MAVESAIATDGKTLKITVKGRFDFGQHQAFRRAYEDFPRSDYKCVEVDLREVGYLDSSALGMLLLLRDHAGGEEADIKIININSDVRKILAISNFHKLFKLDEQPLEPGDA